MTSRLAVVLVSLLVATPAVIFWLWLVIQPARVEILCPEECRCEIGGFYVNCSDSGLNSIPSILPTDAEVLVLDYNNITYFENDSFVSKGLVELQIIKADFCEIRKIELGAFNGLTKLTYLSVKGNEISEIIPGTLEEVSRLEYLDLSYNRIEHLESDVFRGLVNLKRVTLEGNKLQYLHPDTFAGLPNFQSLFLSNNSDLQIPTDRHFINSHSLKKLGISGCNVSSVPVETFANVSALEWLDLSYNNLRSLDINILKASPKLSAIYLYGNPLQCDCQLQEVWRWCQDHNIQTAYKDIAPECDTPSEVKGIWWGVLEKGQCLQGNIYYYGDYKNASYSYTHIEDTHTDIEIVLSFFNHYGFLVYAVPCIFGTTCNVILIIIIICNKDMRTVPNMYILSLAVSDMSVLTLLYSAFWLSIIPKMWLDFICAFFSFFYRLPVGLSAYSVAMLSIQRYRVTVSPFQFRVTSQRTWRVTAATICGVWIVAALFALPGSLSRCLCIGSIFLWRSNYYKFLAIFQLLVSCVIPLCVIAFCYIMMARHLVDGSRSLSEETQNPRLNTRKITAKVVLGLTVVFLISHVPYFIAETYFYFSLNLDISSYDSDLVNNLMVFKIMSEILLTINSCLNPVALCCTSLAFRRHFKRYLTCCCKSNSPPTEFELTKRN